MNTNQRKFLIACCIGIFLCMLDTTVMNIALPTIQDSFKVNLNQISWALNIYTILFASLTIPLSRLSDYIGKERLYIISLILFFFSSMLCGFSTNIVMLIIGRMFQGISASLIFPLSMVIAISTVPTEKRSTIIAFLGVSQGFAAAIGPTIGGIITQYLGWHFVFFINIPLVIISLILCFISLDFTCKINLKKITSVDYRGSILAMTCMFIITIILLKINEWGWSSIQVILLLIITVILTTMFIINERNHNNPIIPLDIFKDKQFLATSITVILSNIFLICMMVTLPSMLTNIQGYSELKAALLITPISIMIFIFSPISAILIKKIGPKIIITIGFISMSLGYWLLASLNQLTLLPFILSCTIIGFGYGIIIGPATILAASTFVDEMLTASQSIIGVVRQVGIILGVTISVSLLTNNIDEAKTYSIENAYKIIDTIEFTNNSSLSIKIKDKLKQEAMLQIEDRENQNEESPSITNEQKQNIKKYIYENPEVEKKLTQKEVSEITSKIKSTNYLISQNSINYIFNAFLNVYKLFIPLIFLSSFITLLFPKYKE